MRASRHLWVRAVAILLMGMGMVMGAAAETKMGVVVMHGKWGSPQGPTNHFAARIENAGFVVESPELPWSRNRLYDTGIEGLAKELDKAIQALRAKGATRVCLAGHSLGAAGAIVYAGRVKLDCLIVMAPGHNPESQWTRDFTAGDLAKAKEMVANGAGDDQAVFEDFNSGNRRQKINMRANIYIEYFDGDGPFNMAVNASKIQPGTPVLWLVGAQEAQSPRQHGDAAFERITGTAKKYVEVPGGHIETPKVSGQIAIDWMRETLK